MRTCPRHRREPLRGPRLLFLRPAPRPVRFDQERHGRLLARHGRGIFPVFQRFSSPTGWGGKSQTIVNIEKTGLFSGFPALRAPALYARAHARPRSLSYLHIHWKSGNDDDYRTEINDLAVFRGFSSSPSGVEKRKTPCAHARLFGASHCLGAVYGG